MRCPPEPREVKQDIKVRTESMSSGLPPGGSANLVAPPGDGGDDVSTGRVPLHVRGHVVLCYVHHGAVRGVHEGESPVHTEHRKHEGENI